MITKLFITLDRENYSLSFDVSYVNITVIALEQRATAQKTLCQQLSILKAMSRHRLFNIILSEGPLIICPVFICLISPSCVYNVRTSLLLLLWQRHVLVTGEQVEDPQCPLPGEGRITGILTFSPEVVM